MIGYNIDKFYKDIQWIATNVQVYADEVKSELLRWDPDVIIAIARGGCVPGVYLSHILNKQLEIVNWQTRDGARKESLEFMTKHRQALIVDDINDSGLTFTEILDNISEITNLSQTKLARNVKTATLWQRDSSNYRVDICPNKIDREDWIVFPWEVPPIEPYSKA